MDCFLMVHYASNIYLFYFILFYGLIYFFFQVKACQEIWDASTFVDGIPGKLFWLVHLTQGYLKFELDTSWHETSQMFLWVDNQIYLRRGKEIYPVSVVFGVGKAVYPFSLLSFASVYPFSL